MILVPPAGQPGFDCFPILGSLRLWPSGNDLTAFELIVEGWSTLALLAVTRSVTPTPLSYLPNSRSARKMARPKRFELLTPRFVVWCSIQLSYGRFLPPPGRSPGVADGVEL